MKKQWQKINKKNPHHLYLNITMFKWDQFLQNVKLPAPQGGQISADRLSTGFAVMIGLTEALKSQQHATKIHLDHSSGSVNTVTVV